MSAMEAIPELDRGGLRRFGLTTGAIVVVLFGVLVPWLLGRGLPIWPWALAGVLAVWSLTAPGSLRPVYRGWMRFGLVMSKVMIPLIMGFVYYLVVTPLGLLRRGLAKDEFTKQWDSSLTTYRLPKTRGKPDDLKRPF